MIEENSDPPKHCPGLAVIILLCHGRHFFVRRRRSLDVFLCFITSRMHRCCDFAGILEGHCCSKPMSLTLDIWTSENLNSLIDFLVISYQRHLEADFMLFKMVKMTRRDWKESNLWFALGAICFFADGWWPGCLGKPRIYLPCCHWSVSCVLHSHW